MEPAVIGALISAFILVVGVGNFYLSHVRTGRSNVTLQAESSAENADFAGGNLALDEKAQWNGQIALKLSNTGPKGGYVSSYEYELIGLREGNEVVSPGGTKLDLRLSQPVKNGQELNAQSSSQIRPSFCISPEHDIGELVNRDAAIIEQTLVIEDNKGSYEVSEISEMGLSGPSDVAEQWAKEVEKNCE